MSESEALWTRIESVTRTLNLERDKVAKAIGVANKRLAGFSPGIEVWLEKPIPGFEGDQEKHLGYCRTENGWELCVGLPRLPICDSAKRRTEQTLAKSSLEVRIAAFPQIDELLEVLYEKAVMEVLDLKARSLEAGITAAVERKGGNG